MPVTHRFELALMVCEIKRVKVNQFDKFLNFLRFDHFRDMGVPKETNGQNLLVLILFRF